MSILVDARIPAGNILVNSIQGMEVSLNKDLRDTEGDWFYWQFRAVFDEPGVYRFRFENGPAIGVRGPAVSYDGGKTWSWLGLSCVSRIPVDSFTYEYQEDAPREVIFCMGMQYLQHHLDDFLASCRGNPTLSKSVLCKSRKERDVELITIQEGDPAGKRNLFFSSRHHCCEMMATYGLEGVLRAASANDEFGRSFRKKFNLFAVPFVDKDGVEDGDQGKNRRPHDHNRDYGQNPIYPEVRAIKKLAVEKQVSAFVDMHCPWLYGEGKDSSNECFYFVGNQNPEMQARGYEMAAILQNRSAAVPFFSRDLVKFGTAWNVGAGSGAGDLLASSTWAGRQSFVEFAVSNEIPYANARELTLLPDMVRQYGEDLLHSLVEFLK